MKVEGRLIKVSLHVAFLACFFAPNHVGAKTLFDTRIDYAAGTRPVSIAVGDLDGDNLPDLATANEYSDDISILLGNGDGTIQDAVSYAAGDRPSSQE